MSICEKIVDSCEMSILEKVKASKFPLYLWGKGDVAGVLYDYLIKEGVIISGVVLDESDNSVDWRGLPVCLFDSNELPDRYSIVVAHSHYELADALQSRISQIMEIFCFTAVLFDKTYNISKEYIIEHKQEYDNSYERMADKLSRDSYIAYLNVLLSDDYRYILPYVCSGMDYFNNDIWHIGQNEIYVDCGAYDGDTIHTFLGRCENRYKYIYAFEVDKANFRRLQHYIRSEKLANVSCECSGLWDQVGVLRLDSYEGQEARINDCGNNDGNEIPVTTLDTYFEGKSVDFIKINYIPGKIETLHGAKYYQAE